MPEPRTSTCFSATKRSAQRRPPGEPRRVYAGSTARDRSASRRAATRSRPSHILKIVAGRRVQAPARWRSVAAAPGGRRGRSIGPAHLGEEGLVQDHLQASRPRSGPTGRGPASAGTRGTKYRIQSYWLDRSHRTFGIGRTVPRTTCRRPARSCAPRIRTECHREHLDEDRNPFRRRAPRARNPRGRARSRPGSGRGRHRGRRRRWSRGGGAGRARLPSSRLRLWTWLRLRPPLRLPSEPLRLRARLRLRPPLRLRLLRRQRAHPRTGPRSAAVLRSAPPQA